MCVCTLNAQFFNISPDTAKYGKSASCYTSLYINKQVLTLLKCINSCCLLHIQSPSNVKDFSIQYTAKLHTQLDTRSISAETIEYSHSYSYNVLYTTNHCSSVRTLT